jgi:hypothetical protein
MKTFQICLVLICVFASCGKDNLQKNFISADINGTTWKTENLQITTDPSTNELSFFSGEKDVISIGIKLGNYLPPYPPGNYNFRNANILPASLISFNVVTDQQHPKLSWSTSQETGLQSFIIERATDGINFTNIGTVPATNTPTVHDYEYTDVTAGSVQVKYYYRLKMLDNAGQSSYSSTRVFSGDDYTAYLGQDGFKYKGFNGTLNIVSHDRNARILTGNFSFDIINDTGQTRQVRNGSFRIKY